MNRFKREPARVGPSVVTLFGDAIVPRDGANDGSRRRRERKHSYFDARRGFYSLLAALRDSFILYA